MASYKEMATTHSQGEGRITLDDLRTLVRHQARDGREAAGSAKFYVLHEGQRIEIDEVLVQWHYTQQQHWDTDEEPPDESPDEEPHEEDLWPDEDEEPELEPGDENYDPL